MRILLLGGTSEASGLARLLAATDYSVIFSYAGRTKSPDHQPLPTRIGGFGGVIGLLRYIEDERITHIIDATHPFAAQMSRNAFEAAQQSSTALLSIERPPWQAVKGDIWQEVPDIEAAVTALPAAPARVFLTIGRQNLAAFEARREHRYFARMINSPGEVDLPHLELTQARGPFSLEAERAFMQRNGITHLVSKNSGGEGSKLIAARELRIPVIMVARPTPPPDRLIVSRPENAMGWLSHQARRGV